jgi:hypothetical protein
VLIEYCSTAVLSGCSFEFTQIEPKSTPNHTREHPETIWGPQVPPKNGHVHPRRRPESPREPPQDAPGAPRDPPKCASGSQKGVRETPRDVLSLQIRSGIAYRSGEASLFHARCCESRAVSFFVRFFREDWQIEHRSENSECVFRTAPASRNEGSAASLLDLANVDFVAAFAQ